MFFYKVTLGKKTIWVNRFHQTLHIDNAEVLEMSQLNDRISFSRENPQCLSFHPCSKCHMFTPIPTVRVPIRFSWARICWTLKKTFIGLLLWKTIWTMLLPDKTPPAPADSKAKFPPVLWNSKGRGSSWAVIHVRSDLSGRSNDSPMLALPTKL